MSFINIRLVFNNQTISIIFEEIHKANQRPVFPGDLKKFGSDILIYHHSQRMDAYSIIRNMISFADEASLKKACQAEKSTFTFKASHQQKEELYTKTSFAFELSSTPHVVLIWLGLMSTVFNEARAHYEFSDRLIESSLTTASPDAECPSLCVPLEEYFSKDASGSTQKTLLTHILAISENFEPYAASRESVRIMNEYYLKNNTPFIEALSSKIQDGELYAKAGEKTTDTLAPLSSRVSQLVMFVQELIKADQNKEAQYVVKHINCMAKQVIFKKCLEKKAADGGRYSYGYTEWDFFRHAEFKLLNDGRMSINVDQNLGYIEHYAVGKRNHGIFKDEMIFLAKIIGFEFDPATDFNKEIILTAACSKKLKNIGIHLSLDYIMKLLQQKNHFSLFRQAYEFHGQDGNEFSNKLPVEIGEMIFKELASPELDKDDVQEVCNQAWNNRL